MDNAHNDVAAISTLIMFVNRSDDRSPAGRTLIFHDLLRKGHFESILMLFQRTVQKITLPERASD